MLVMMHSWFAYSSLNPGLFLASKTISLFVASVTLLLECACLLVRSCFRDETRAAPRTAPAAASRTPRQPDVHVLGARGARALSRTIAVRNRRRPPAHIEPFARLRASSRRCAHRMLLTVRPPLHLMLPHLLLHFGDRAV